jgi:hypothetical protein
MKGTKPHLVQAQDAIKSAPDCTRAVKPHWKQNRLRLA